MEYFFLAAYLIFLGEGYRTLPYDDKTGKTIFPSATAGRTTVGIGFNLTDVGISFKESIGILFLRLYEIDNKLVDIAWFQNLTAPRKAAIMDMIYNMGFPEFNQFRGTITALAANNYIQASNSILASQYAKQVTMRAERNAKIIRTGKIEL